MKPLQIQPLILAGSGINATQTEITVKKFKLRDASETPVTTAMLGTKQHATIEPGTSREELITFTGVTQNANGTATLTGVVRGFQPHDGNTVNTNFRFTHPGGSALVISNTAKFYEDEFAKKNRNEEIAGLWSVPTPTAAAHIATKAYVDSIVNGGNISYDTLIVDGVAGENITKGDLVYFDTVTNNEWMKFSASSSFDVTDLLLGIAQGSGANGVNIVNGVLLFGIDRTQTGLTAGQFLYASDTAGQITSTPGTVEVLLGISKDVDEIYFLPRYVQNIQGTVGEISPNNKVVTENNTYSGSYDVVQETDDSTIEIGEADATGRKLKVAQQFTATSPKIYGSVFKKKPDTGVYQGTVTISLQEDNGSDEPNGVDLASVTMSQTYWRSIDDNSEFEALFNSQYNDLAVGSKYWLIATVSAPSNTIHPNFAYNAGASTYAGGLLKYNNATDGWVAVAGDLYFKVLEGRENQVVVTDSNGNAYGTRKPTIRNYKVDRYTVLGDSNSQYDITVSGTTVRYTYDGTGINPNLGTNLVVGDYVYINAFNTANRGFFKVTAVDTNYFEVINPAGFAENNVDGIIIRLRGELSLNLGTSTTQCDITNPSGNIMRVTYDSTGTNPYFEAYLSVGDYVNIQAQNFNVSNNGVFRIINVDTNYFEVINPFVVVETDKTFGTGFIQKHAAIWTRPANLSWIEVEVQGAGGSAGGGIDTADQFGNGGSAGGYAKKIIDVSNLNKTEPVFVGLYGTITDKNENGLPGFSSSFSSHVFGTGGSAGIASGAPFNPVAGVGLLGDVNISGQEGGRGISSGPNRGGDGGSSVFSFGVRGSAGSGVNGSGFQNTENYYGAGGAGGGRNTFGGSGGPGLVIIKEYY